MAPDQRRSPDAPPTYVNANRLWVDSRLRYEIGLRVEGRILHRLGARGAVAVEIGTGRRGLGARVAVEVLGAAEVTAFDLYPARGGRAPVRGPGLAARGGPAV